MPARLPIRALKCGRKLRLGQRLSLVRSLLCIVFGLVCMGFGKRGQGAFEYILLIGGLLMVVAIILLSVQTVSSTSISQVGKYCPPTDMGQFSQGLAGSWHFDEGGGTVAVDSSGNGNNAVLVGNTNPPNWVPGVMGQAVGFSSANGARVWIPYSASLVITQQITFGGWMYKDNWQTAPAKANYLVSKRQNGGYGIRVSATAIEAWLYRNGGYATPYPSFSTTGLAAGWHHIFATYDGRYTKLYVDGDLKATNDAGGQYAIAYSAPGDSVFIGHDADGNNDNIPDTANGDYFDGKIDEVKIYSRALSQAEIRADMTCLPRKGI